MLSINSISKNIDKNIDRNIAANMARKLDPIALIKRAQNVLQIEADAILALKPIINGTFIYALEAMFNCKGRVVVMGMGKSGHIGSKIAATLASTGTPAFFVHPAEASHGDLGMIIEGDVVLALSNSGETDEIISIIALIKRLKVPLIAITGNPHSSLAKAAEAHLLVQVKEEACPLGLAPTASTTAALAMGDALAVALLEARGFTVDDFARSHPGGKLGRRLLLRVTDVMADLSNICMINIDAKLTEVLMSMTRNPVGIAVIVDADLHILGVFTEGDLRRTLIRQLDIHQTTIDMCMTAKCTVIQEDSLAIDAVRLMEEKCITAIPVIKNMCLIGVINMHHLLNARVI